MQMGEHTEQSTGPSASLLPPESVSRWPKTIGVISLIYAICGLLCQTSFVAWTFLGEQLAKMGGMNIEVPGAMKLIVVVSGATLIMLGILMITGSVNLLRRRRTGVKQLMGGAAGGHDCRWAGIASRPLADEPAHATFN